MQLHIVKVVSTVALQQKGPGFDSGPGVFLDGVFSLCTFGLSLGTPAFCRFKNINVRLIVSSKMSFVSVQACDGLPSC